MKSWTIGKKLFAGIGTLLTLMSATAWIGLHNASDLSRRMEDAAGFIAAQIVHSNRVEQLAQSLEQTALEIALAPGQQNERGNTLRFQASSAVEALDEEIATLYRVVDSEEDRRDVAKIREACARWKTEFKRFDAAVLAGRVDYSALQAASEGMEKAAKVISDAQFREMNASKVAAAESYRSQRAFALSAWALSLLIGGVAVWIVLDVNRQLRRTAADLLKGSVETNGAAAQVASSSQSLAQGSSEQAASLEETSASAEEINSMARQNSESSRSAASLVASSQESFALADGALAEMVASMDEIKASSEKISKIIRIIDEIAFQTNILALNAAVEAARAGDAGMGFAVVADEVRNLAHRCAEAAQDTSVLIEESVSKAAAGKGKVDRVAAAVRSVSDALVRVRGIVDSVESGSREQARGIEQIGSAILQMEEVTQRAAAEAEHSAAAAEELTAQSEAMRKTVNRLTAMVGAA